MCHNELHVPQYVCVIMHFMYSMYVCVITHFMYLGMYVL